MSEPIKPIFPCVVMSNTIHAYISQSDKGELVIGAGTDAYTSYTQRGALHINTHTLDAICELFPQFRRLRMLRNWGGIVDVTPDRSPIIAKTPVPGLYVNCGWGTGGFKATPGSAHVFAWTIARDEPHPINAPFTHRALSRRLPDRRGRGGRRGPLRGSRMLLIACPYCGERPEIEFTYGGEAHLARPAQPCRSSTIRRGPNFSTCAPTPRACTPSAGATRAAAGDSSMRCATPPPISFSRSTRPASRGPALARPATRTVSYRTAAGGRIDRARAAALRLRRPRYQGFAGDTLASALLANGVHLVGRSFKYHRPRGILDGRRRGAERAGHGEPRCGALSRRICAPRRSSCTTGLIARKPESLAEPRARRRPHQRLRCRRSFPAGFYYKTFMWPRKAWKALYEPRDSPRRGPRASRRRSRIPTATRSATRTATCWWSARGPRARGRARRRRRGRPRHPLRRAGGIRRQPARRRAARASTASRRSTGCSSRVAALRAITRG